MAATETVELEDPVTLGPCGAARRNSQRTEPACLQLRKSAIHY
jgi:hypothetical protein